MQHVRIGDVSEAPRTLEDGARSMGCTDDADKRQVMTDTNGPNQTVTIKLERWRWEQILMCLDRYVSVLRGDDDALDDIASDAEWANQLDAMTYEFRALVNAGGNLTPGSGGNE
jgi:hypothetical protein